MRHIWQNFHEFVGPRLNSCVSSALSAANGTSATPLFGCMTTSHPGAISRQCSRTISRTRRRIRLRTTAPPKAFLMLKPKRLSGRSFAFRKTVKWELARRFPARYTASNSAFRTSLPVLALAAAAVPASRGTSCPPLFRREAMTSLLAACRQYLPPACRFHPRAETVRFRAPPLARLIRPFWQSNPPLFLRVALDKSYPEAKSSPSGRSPGSSRIHKCTCGLRRGSSKRWDSL